MTEKIAQTKTTQKKVKKSGFKRKRSRKNVIQSPASPSPVGQILSLQGSIGNQAVMRLIKTGAVQAKLKTGSINEKYESEALRNEDKVMSMPEPKQPLVQQQVTKPGIRRKIKVDKGKFKGANAAKEFRSFKQMILNELQTVTGLKLKYSGDELVRDTGTSQPRGGSKTAAMVLDMALKSSAIIFIDPSKKLGGEHKPQRGIDINIKLPSIVLKAMRAGITIIHELTHRFAARLKPPNYDRKMKALMAKAKSGKPLNLEESALLTNYRPQGVQTDENITMALANKVRAELGLIKRMFYELQIEYPPKPGAKGLDKFTSYTQFKTATSPPLYVYVSLKNWDIYTSKIDYAQEMAKLRRPPTPKPADFNKVTRGSAYYNAIKSQLL